MNLLELENSIKENTKKIFILNKEESTLKISPDYENWLLSTMKEVDYGDEIDGSKENFDFLIIQESANKFHLYIFDLKEGFNRISELDRFSIRNGFLKKPMDEYVSRFVVEIELNVRANSWEDEFLFFKNFYEYYGFIPSEYIPPTTSLRTDMVGFNSTLVKEGVKFSMNVISLAERTSLFNKMCLVTTKKAINSCRKIKINKFLIKIFLCLLALGFGLFIGWAFKC